MTHDRTMEARRNEIRALSETMSRKDLIAHLTRAAGLFGVDRFRKEAVFEILRKTRPESAIPDIYADYRGIVKDGVEFLLTRLSLSRLVDIALDGLIADPPPPPEAALAAMAKKIPTLQKLGQIIARNRNLDPRFRRRFVDLEFDEPGADTAAAVMDSIRVTLGAAVSDFAVRFEDRPIAEASVSVVWPFQYTDPKTGETAAGVLKTLKPGITETLTEEFTIFTEMAKYFHDNRHRYPLPRFRFTDVFREVREILEQEIDLTGEQEHLLQASRFYGTDETVKIPRLLPALSRPAVTAMERIEGGKITRPDADPPTRRSRAARLFHALILKPLFSGEAAPPIHGDPHAGNLFAGLRARADAVVLLDWSLTGHLSISERAGLFRLAAAVFVEDRQKAAEAIDALSTDNPRGLEAFVTETFDDSVFADVFAVAPLLRKVFLLLDRAIRNGFMFSKNLSLFRKAFFTLEGVLYELDPDFDASAAVWKAVAKAAGADAPARLWSLFFPGMDTPARYLGRLTNRELSLLAVRMGTAEMERAAGRAAAFSAAMVSEVLFNPARWLGQPVFFG